MRNVLGVLAALAFVWVLILIPDYLWGREKVIAFAAIVGFVLAIDSHLAIKTLKQNVQTLQAEVKRLGKA